MLVLELVVVDEVKLLEEDDEAVVDVLVSVELDEDELVLGEDGVLVDEEVVLGVLELVDEVKLLEVDDESVVVDVLDSVKLDEDELLLDKDGVLVDEENVLESVELKNKLLEELTKPAVMTATLVVGKFTGKDVLDEDGMASVENG